MSPNTSLQEEELGSPPSPDNGVDRAEVRTQIERILKSESFKASVRISRFLRYVTEAALDGRFEEIKETCIGVAAYDRDPSYDPKTDTVVRSEARRLRQKLNQYYETVGKLDLVVIALPKGAYIPTFTVLNTDIKVQDDLEANFSSEVIAALPPVLSVATISEPASSRNGTSPRGLVILSLSALLVIGIGLLFIVRGRRQQALVAVKVLPLTSLSGQVFQPAVSPDGIDTAFIWNQGGSNYSIYITQPQGKALRLTTGNMNDLHPSWSPDGRSLAFLRTSSDGADVMTIAVPGGMEREAFSLKSPRPWGDDQLGARDDTGPTWSPDRQSLLVSDTAPSGHGLSIFLRSIDGSASKPLSYPEGEDRDLSPTPSPDGEWVAFVRFTVTTPQTCTWFRAAEAKLGG